MAIEDGSDVEPKNPQMPEDQAKILVSATNNDIDGVATGALEIMAAQ